MTAELDAAPVSDAVATGRLGLTSRQRSALVAIVVVGVALRLVLLPIGSGSDRLTTYDSASYLNVARHLPGAYWSPKGSVVADSLSRTPGYPTFLWIATGGTGNLGAAAVANAIVGGFVTVLLAFLLARELLPRRPSVWLVGAGLVAVEPVSIAYSYLVLTETLFGATFVGFLYLASRALRQRTVASAVLAGAGLASATLVRPTTIYLAPLLALALVAVRPRARSALLGVVFAVTALVPVGAWMARNHHVSGVTIYSTIEGTNAFGLRAADAVAREQGVSLTTAQRQLDEQYAKQLASPNPAEVARFQSSQGLRIVARHPKGYLLSAAAGLRIGVTGAAYPWIEKVMAPSSLASRLHPVLMLTSLVGLLAIYLAMAMGTAALVRARAWRAACVLIGPATYYFLLSAGPEMKARFRVPIVPEMAIVAAFGIVCTWEWVQHRAASRGSASPAPPS